MATFAIVRADGTTDRAEGASVDDIASRYGWPGNGKIEPYDSASHDKALRHTFADPTEQRELLADKPTAVEATSFSVKAAKTDKTADAEDK
jgi:hypothetical protein